MARRLTVGEVAVLKVGQGAGLVAAEGRVFVAVGPFCWGKSRDALEAVRNAERNRVRVYEGKAGWRYVLYEAPASATVHEVDGSLNWTWPEGGEPPAPATVVYRHRMPEREVR